MTFTLDANVLLYASDRSSPRHARASEIIDSVARGPEISYLFWPTLMAYIRIATHPGVFSEPLSTRQAITNVGALVGRPHIQSPGEGERFWSRFTEVAGDPAVQGNLIPDAQLVALMAEHGVRDIWTHDRGFRRFPGINVVDPFA